MANIGFFTKHPSLVPKFKAMAEGGARPPELAVEFGISRGMVNYYLRQYGLAKGKGSGTYKPDYSNFAKWLKEQKGKKIPVSHTELAKLSGCSTNEIKCYFYRRRERARDVVFNFIKTYRKTGAFISRKEHLVPLKSVRTWEVTFENGYSKPHLTLFLYGGGIEFSTFDMEHIRKNIGDYVNE